MCIRDRHLRTRDHDRRGRARARFFAGERGVRKLTVDQTVIEPHMATAVSSNTCRYACPAHTSCNRPAHAH
eukprot:8799555-Alexandrium_andersonii.AAC.1